MELRKKVFLDRSWALIKSNPIVVLLVVASIVVGFSGDNFFSWGNFGNLVSNTAIGFLVVS